GRLAPVDGRAALRALDRAPSRHSALLTVLSFGLSAAAIAVLLGGGVPTLATAGAIGIVTGGMFVTGAGRPQLVEALEAAAALVATLLAAAIATFLVPLSLKTAIVASLIVLMPGLMLTNAVS